MKFSDGRLSYLSHKIVDTLKTEGLADIEREKYVLAEIKHVLEAEHQRADRIDDAVRQKIASLSRHVPPGSHEWDILYKRYYTEEERRKKS
jgi:hypothetical protein